MCHKIKTNPLINQWFISFLYIRIVFNIRAHLTSRPNLAISTFDIFYIAQNKFLSHSNQKYIAICVQHSKYIHFIY